MGRRILETDFMVREYSEKGGGGKGLMNDDRRLMIEEGIAD
jgi:hypothetical protein